jgi:hypothetical protein
MTRLRFSACLFFVLGFTALKAQLSVEEFLGSVREDPEVKTFDDQINYLNTKPYRLAPLREVQLRTQNRELMQTQQEYGIRVSPSNPWEMRRQNAYFKEMNAGLALEKEIVRKDALFDRYNTIIEYLYNSSVHKLTIVGKQKLDQQINIVERQSGSRYFDADSYVKLRADQLDFLIEEEEFGFETSNQISRITRTYPKAHNQRIDWDFDKAISLEQIKKVCDSIERAGITSSLARFYQQQIKLAKSEYELEKTNIGFLQTSYDRRRYHQDRNPFSVSVGVSLPIFNPNKGNMTKRRLDEIEAEYDYTEETYQSESDKIILKEKVLSLVARVKNLEEKIDVLEKSNLAQTLSTIKEGDPVAVIQFRQRVIKIQTLYYKVKRELFLAFTEYLYATDALQAEPLTNYLSPRLTRY